MLNTEMLKKYARMYMARKKIRAKDKELTAELVKMQKVLLDHLDVEGIDKFSFKGGLMVFRRTRHWPKYEDKKLAIEAFKAANMGDMVSEDFNAQTISSYLTELFESGQDLPKEFEGKLESNPVQTLIVKKV